MLCNPDNLRVKVHGTQIKLAVIHMSISPKFLREWKSESEETQGYRPARLEEVAVISKRADFRK